MITPRSKSGLALVLAFAACGGDGAYGGVTIAYINDGFDAVASAYFFPAPDFSTEPGCYYVANSIPPLLDGGEVTLTTPGKTYRLPRGEENYYGQIGLDPVDVAPGTTIRVTTAGGADLPAFSIEGVMPEHPQLDIQPPLASGLSLQSVTTLTWTPSGNDEDYVTIQFMAGVGGFFCQARDADGSMQIDYTAKFVLEGVPVVRVLANRRRLRSTSAGGSDFQLYLLNRTDTADVPVTP